MNTTKNIVVLGIDPGTNHTGYCLMSGHFGQFQQTQILDIGIFSPHKAKHEEKLKSAFDFFAEYIKNKKPHLIIIENAFLGKNVQSMLKLGRLQGVLFAICYQHKIPVMTFSPGEVKQSVTGRGNASKEQISFMIRQLFHLSDKLQSDATDAAAIAFTYFLKTKQFSTTKSNWEKFLQQNPDRIL